MRGDAEVHQLDRAILEERAKIGDGAAHAELAREGVRALAVRRCDGDQLNVDAAHVVIGLGMLRVVLPLCVPGLLSAGIFAFTLAQNEFLYALIFLAKSDVRTVPVGAITELIRGDVFYWGQLMAAALLGSIPVALIYSFFVDYYVEGLTAGSVKS